MSIGGYAAVFQAPKTSPQTSLTRPLHDAAQWARISCLLGLFGRSSLTGATACTFCRRQIDLATMPSCICCLRISYITNSTASTLVCQHMSQWGVPKRHLSDKYQQCPGTRFAAVCAPLDSWLLFTSAYHAQTTGGTERVNRTTVQNDVTVAKAIADCLRFAPALCPAR